MLRILIILRLTGLHFKSILLSPPGICGSFPYHFIDRPWKSASFLQILVNPSGIQRLFTLSTWNFPSVNPQIGAYSYFLQKPIHMNFQLSLKL